MSSKTKIQRVRNITELSQTAFAALLTSFRPTIQALEYGKLRLSQKMAERIMLHTGVSLQWLLDPRPTPPTCEREAGRPYTREIFQWTRAEIEHPRTAPNDVAAINAYVQGFGRQLGRFAVEAYTKNEIPYFYYMWRQFEEALSKRWPLRGPEPAPGDLYQQLERARALKLRENPVAEPPPDEPGTKSHPPKARRKKGRNRDISQPTRATSREHGQTRRLAEGKP
jgi:hypothetical protein